MNVEMREILGLIDAANARRRSTPDFRDATLDSLFQIDERLAVYGSLAPGRQNHHIVAPLGGAWSEGIVEGDLALYGWGAAIGFPALRLRAGGPPVAVHVLASPRLRRAWSSLDAFEGAEYRRMLAPVWSVTTGAERALVTVANIYEAALDPDPPLDKPSGA